ncbi:hypothetical protein LP420_01080 [Massilia sp. B-10]|nr:hypothetical protein LP420_01080 [Massilia sp. B-10]
MIIFGGFAVGLLYKVANISFKGWKDTSNFGIRRAPQGKLGRGRDFARAAGRRLHHRTAHRNDDGSGTGVLSYLLLIPMIKFFGDLLTVPVSPGTMLIHDMTANDIRSAYVLYIGSQARWRPVA